ncbi:MAG: RluA family pseudouridine synthase [Eubacteriales bacterium]|nr:RluA family pseudouridine synthase [Eubacteriales bacterium]
MERRLEFSIAEHDWTIEKYLRAKAGFTKKQVSQAKFRAGGFRVNGKQQRCDYTLKAGDVLVVPLEEKNIGSRQILPLRKPLEVLYEDEDLLAVKKPAGLVCHPAGGHYEDTLANQVAAYFESQGICVRIRPVGRLDREVSGIVLFAKNQMAASRLTAQRKNGEYCKEYIADVEGSIEQAEILIRTPVQENPEKRGQMQVHPEGKEAVTRVQVLERQESITRVLCRIDTGRMHQIRVHLSSIGHPIAGDVLYGAGQRRGSGICLHAWRIVCVQPFTGEKIELLCEPPF